MADRSVTQKAQRGGGGRWPDFFRGVRGAGEDARRALTRPDQTQSNGRRSPPVAVAADDHTEKSVSPEPRILLPAGRCATRRRPHFVLSRALLCWLSCSSWWIIDDSSAPMTFLRGTIVTAMLELVLVNTTSTGAAQEVSLSLPRRLRLPVSVVRTGGVLPEMVPMAPCASDFAGAGALARRVIVRWADGDNPMLVGVPGRRTSV